MASNYYVILGVDPDATLDQIKSAYRDQAKKLHPDRCGGGAGPFRAVQEAYEVLRDPARRKAYDDDLARFRRSARHTRRRSAPPRRSPVEPVMSGSRFDEMGFDREFGAFLEEIFGREWLDIGLSNHPAGLSGSLQTEIGLTRQQAQNGGTIRIEIPAQTRCPACHGRGQAGYFVCRRCSGTGITVSEYPLDFEFPPGIADGATGRVSLHELGLPGEYLIVRFRVRDW